MTDKTSRNYLINQSAEEEARFEASREQELSALRNELLRQRDENIELRSSLEKERHAARAHIDAREKELDAKHAKLRKELALREDRLEKELQDQLQRLEAEREQSAQRSFRLINEAQEEMERVASERNRLKLEMEAFEEEKERYDEEANEKLQRTSSSFVEGVITDLRTREKNLMGKSTIWSVFGGGALLFALAIAAIAIHSTSTDLADEIPVTNVVFLLVKGTFFMGIAGVIARFAFVLSKRYLAESLRVSDIIHGVSFGQMYVQSYGATAGWDQVKEAFSEWHDKPKQDHENTDSQFEENLDFGHAPNKDLLKEILDTVKGLKS
jgi:hypothetical protein